MQDGKKTLFQSTLHSPMGTCCVTVVAKKRAFGIGFGCQYSHGIVLFSRLLSLWTLEKHAAAMQDAHP